MDDVSKKIYNFFSKYPETKYPKDNVIIYPNKEIPFIYYLESGVVRQYVNTIDGEELTLNLFKAKSYFPIMLVLSSEDNKYMFQALTNVSVYKAPTSEVLSFVKDNPDVSFELLVRISKGLSGTLVKIQEQLPSNAYRKVAALLVYLTKSFGKIDDDKIIIDIPLTHYTIASWLGLQRETVSRQMEILAKKKVIQYKNRFIRVRNIKLLKKEGASRFRS
jgi:CRP-like cAMP-binding protein